MKIMKIMRNILRFIAVLVELFVFFYMWNLGWRVTPLCILLAAIMTIIMIFTDNDDTPNDDTPNDPTVFVLPTKKISGIQYDLKK